MERGGRADGLGGRGVGGEVKGESEDTAGSIS
jgi:hypothetical protein